MRWGGALLIALAAGLLAFHGVLEQLIDPGGQDVIFACLTAVGLGVGLVLGSLGLGGSPADRWLRRWRLARAAALCVVIILVLIGVDVYVHRPPMEERVNLIPLGFVAFFAGAVGFAELTERYRDDPARLFAADPTIMYVAINVAAGIAALALVKEFQVFSDTQPHAQVYEVLLASFGSIAFFRSSLFTARVGDKDVDVGPATLLKSLLETSDRMINRSQARERADDASVIMRRVDFNKAKTALPALCFTAVENITVEDQEQIGKQVNTLIADPNMSDSQRSIILGMRLIRAVGPLVLARAVTALGDSILETRS